MILLWLAAFFSCYSAPLLAGRDILCVLLPLFWPPGGPLAGQARLPSQGTVWNPRMPVRTLSSHGIPRVPRHINLGDLLDTCVTVLL